MPDVQPSGNTPATPTGEDPKPGEQTSSQPSTPVDTVTLTKDQHDDLQRSAAMAASAQSDRDILKNKLERYENPRRKVEPLPPLEAQAIATVKSQVASHLMLHQQYAPLLQRQPVLAKVLSKNPLDLLEKDEFIDEQDATNQILDYLDAELVKFNEAAAANIVKPVDPAAPPPRTTNPGEEVTPTENDVEGAARKVKAEENAKLPAIKRITNNIADRLKIN